jgi:hypothetical protein
MDDHSQQRWEEEDDDESFDDSDNDEENDDGHNGDDTINDGDGEEDSGVAKNGVSVWRHVRFCRQKYLNVMFVGWSPSSSSSSFSSSSSSSSATSLSTASPSTAAAIPTVSPSPTATSSVSASASSDPRSTDACPRVGVEQRLLQPDSDDFGFGNFGGDMPAAAAAGSSIVGAVTSTEALHSRERGAEQQPPVVARGAHPTLTSLQTLQPVQRGGEQHSAVIPTNTTSLTTPTAATSALGAAGTVVSIGRTPTAVVLRPNPHVTALSLWRALCLSGSPLRPTRTREAVLEDTVLAQKQRVDALVSLLASKGMLAEAEAALAELPPPVGFIGW